MRIQIWKNLKNIIMYTWIVSLRIGKLTINRVMTSLIIMDWIRCPYKHLTIGRIPLVASLVKETRRHLLDVLQRV